MLQRWDGCFQWTARNTENQQNSKILNHDESWTRTLWLLKSALRGHHLNSAKYLKVNLLFLFIAGLVLIVSFSFYGNNLANCFLFICLRARRAETGSKDEHSKHKWPKMFTKAIMFLYIVMLAVALWRSVPNSSLFLSSPARQKLLGVGKVLP